MYSNRLVGKASRRSCRIGRPCRGERWGCQPSLSNRRDAPARGATHAIGISQGQKPQFCAAGLCRNIKCLRARAAITVQLKGGGIRPLINDLRSPSPWPPAGCVAGKVQLHNFLLWKSAGGKSTPLRRGGFRAGTHSPGVRGGGGTPRG